MAKTKYEALILPLSAIEADENQPRKNFDPERLAELMRSIQEHGIMSPLIVEKKPNGKYLLIDGERRYRASKELKLKEVPAVPVEAQSDTERLIQQFHIQEQHEGWSSIEKASAMALLAERLNVNTKELAQMLGIPNRTAETYTAFASLLERKAFQKHETPLVYATRIQGLKKRVKNAFEKHQEEFTREDEHALELAIITRIKSGDIRIPNDVAKIGDAAAVNPSSIRAFLKNSKMSTQKLFLESEAKVALHFRRIVYSANGLISNIPQGMALGVQNLMEDRPYAISALKAAREQIDRLLGKI